MKSNLIYLLINGSVVLLIWVVIQYGNDLKAPPALPKYWVTEELSLSPDCPILQSQIYSLHLKQSGENISVLWSEAPHLELHGKVNQEGNFELAGSLASRQWKNCRKASLTWKGKLDHQTMAGTLLVHSESCSLCPGGLPLKAMVEAKHD